MAEIELTYDLAMQFLDFLRVEMHRDPGDLNLLCLKGVNPKEPGSNVLVTNDDAPDIYNDTVVLLYRDPDGSPGKAVCQLGTVDPGRYYTETDPNPDGAAHLTFGQHRFVKGLHLSKYPALVPVNGINRVWRDKDKDYKPSVDDRVYIGEFGVHVHAGGRGPSIGQNSAGCVNICGGWEGEPWKLCMKLVETHFQGGRRPYVNVTVWTGTDLSAFAQQGAAFRPTLSLGILNPWVGELQQLLNKKGFNLKVDNDWRSGLEQVVVQFQSQNGLTPDGVIGPKGWATLMS